MLHIVFIKVKLKIWTMYKDKYINPCNILYIYIMKIYFMVVLVIYGVGLTL
jgi:hypothetical protein